ncbi:hypothetical protein pb186bvf_000067 [Paramecium bursaria]
MSSDELDLEKQQFQLMYQGQLEQSTKNEPNQNSIGQQYAQPDKIVKPIKKNQSKRPKWCEESNRLFFKLFHIFSGDLHMITDYFNKNTDFKFTSKQIKRKYNTESKDNPQKLKYKYKMRYPQKIQDKLRKIAERLENGQLERNASNISDIVIIRTESKTSEDVNILTNIANEINKML